MITTGKNTILILLVCLLFLTECNRKITESDTSASISKTTVSIGYASDTVTLNNEISLNATATYLLKSDVKAVTTGYITSIQIKPADHVKRGQVLFSLQTKEAKALGNTVNQLDSSFRFSGTTKVASPTSGYVIMLNRQVGDYIQEGETLATISDENNFGFVMNIPYEYNNLVCIGSAININLPDGKTVNGNVIKIMPSLDPAAQTEQVFIKVKNENFPENLIATVRFVKSSCTGLCVPKTAVLTNDFQSEFWVMKLINDTTAIKTRISKGIETDLWVEVLAGNIKPKDRLIVSGNFGMNDTAFVTIK